INENYNYNLRSEELLEKWIVVEITNADPVVRVTRRENFQKMNYCKAYGDYGKMVDCEHAGCYAFYNYNSSIHSDFLLEIEKAFNVKIHGYFGDRHGMNFDSVQTFVDLVKELN
ncbi:hypothetical protein RZS08_65210, partial [Arthrospira platensis SPKY1]|nr:hypothetical protein [Arthrospira platensis SPKY1]